MDDKHFWKEKLAAFLHDPPDKALDFGPHHEDRAYEYVKAELGALDPAWISDTIRGIKDSDWSAAGSDREYFTKGQYATSFGKGSLFHHPLGKCTFEFTHVPALGQAGEALQNAVGGIQPDPTADETEQWHQIFFLYWRRWMEETVRQPNMKELAYFPADTRIPDHTIWTHMAVSSAMHACRDKDKVIKPTFLIFQIGPIQDFIAAARSTRDLWSGSYLLSWLTAHAIKAVTDKLGPDNIIFPALRGQGIFDVLHQESLYSCITYKDGADGRMATLWERMIDSTNEDHICKLLNPTLPNRFFAIVPEEKARALAEKATMAVKTVLSRISGDVWPVFEKLTQGANKDADYISGMKQRWDRQVALFPQITWSAVPWQGTWPETYELADRMLAARRNTRDFDAFTTDDHQANARKDVLTGKEEVIGDKEVWEALHKKCGESGVFRKGEGPYGAMTIIKRLWCRDGCQLYHQLGVDDKHVKKIMKLDSMQAIACKNKAGAGTQTDDDGEYKPNNPYVAVIALDGDQMGKWISGEKLPILEEQLAGAVVPRYDQSKLENQRKLTPSYHMQFSEALANFATHIAGRIVKKHEGLLVYAGGDDVLAVLPADRALACAQDLRAGFRGVAEDFSEPLNSTYEMGIEKTGFALVGKEDYPLMVPGPAADVSCGIAVCHYKYPLQAAIHQAHDAEKRAKNENIYNRGAFALSLIKRGGETIHWGGKWQSHALKLYHTFTQFDDRQCSNRFPYALAALLHPYNMGRSHNADPLPESFKSVVMAEFNHVMSRQCESMTKKNKEKLVKYAEDYLDQCIELGKWDDFVSLFLASTFMNRQRGE
ncbi:MAG: type III-B CRISPR-associated protein Cas10/Cmr2 [Spartobacteria bacterium]|nr:type III-B CRISPR-associated protein Cas10/Cmr2 [Spartobacteria bacterium]